MENVLKFKGNFKQLKKLGYEFMKLYGMNYKVYNKKMKTSSYNIWVWVAKGGYIEIEDLYDNTKQFIKTLKSIDWDNISESTSLDGKRTWKSTNIYYSHANPETKMMVNKRPMDYVVWGELHLRLGDKYLDIIEEDDYKKVQIELFGDLDSYKSITEESCKELLKEFEKIQKC